MNIPSNLKYSKDHEWIRTEGEFGYVGISEFAQGELGDIVFVEIDSVGETKSKDEVFGSVEAVKTVSDLFMPVGGEVLEVNSKLDGQPELVNQDSYGEGWLIKIKISNPEEINQLMDADAYKAHIGH
jgi:glycine cleavage system H protein